VPAYILSSRITDASLYIDALQEADVYAEFPTLFAEQMDYWIKQLEKQFISLVSFFFRNPRPFGLGRSSLRRSLQQNGRQTQTESP